MSLLDTCQECLQVVLPRCPETITIDSDFLPDEVLTLEIEDAYGNKYRIEPDAVYAGSVVFSTEDLPEGLLWSGLFTFRMFQVVSGYYCDVPRLICGDYYCLYVTFENVVKEARICCDESTVDNDDGDDSDSDCPCVLEEIHIHDGETFDLTTTLGNPDLRMLFITVSGVATVIFPKITDVIAAGMYRGIEITITVTTDGVVTLTPDASDSFADNGNGVSIGGVSSYGDGAFIRVGSATIWSMIYS